METFLRFLTGAVMLAVVIDGTMTNIQEPNVDRNAFKNAWEAVREFFPDKKINFKTPNQALYTVAATQAARNACNMYNGITDAKALTRTALEKPSPVEYSAGHVETFSCNSAAIEKDRYAKKLWNAVKKYALLPDVSTQLEFGAYEFEHNTVVQVFVVIAISSACTLQNKNKDYKVDLMLTKDLVKIMGSVSNISLDYRQIGEGLTYSRTYVENLNNTGIEGTLIIVWGDLKDGINLDVVFERPEFPQIFEHALAEFNADADALYGFRVGNCTSHSTKKDTADSPVSQSSFKTVPDLAAVKGEGQPKSATDLTDLVEGSLLDKEEPTLKDQQLQPMDVNVTDPFVELYYRNKVRPEV